MVQSMDFNASNGQNGQIKIGETTTYVDLRFQQPNNMGNIFARAYTFSSLYQKRVYQTLHKVTIELKYL